MPNFLELLDKVKTLNNISEYNEVQNLVLKEEYLNKNIVISSPTSSGKTLCAEIFMLNTVLEKHKRCLFISPLKALTSEHYTRFKHLYEKEFGLKIGISTGDLDSSSKYLENYEIIFLTFEKLDSLIRHKCQWLYSVGLVVVDELHNLDTDRGAILEITIVELKQILKDLQIIGLSATIPNAQQLTEWLDGKLIYSEYRPVKLKKGVLFEGTISFNNETKQIEKGNSSIEDIVLDTLKQNKQALIFMNSRKSAEVLSKKLSHYTANFVKVNEKVKIAKKIEEIESTLQTDYDKDVATNLLSGVSFHHAGLRNSLREITENLFKEGSLKIICATPTLAAGVNLPAFRVIVHSTYRHSENGMLPIPVKEYVQMSGRAGRLGFDSEGESILIAKSEDDVENLFAKYVNAEPEEIESQLGHIPVLRTMLLSIIANEIVFDDDSLDNFFQSTFYVIRFGDIFSLKHKLSTILKELVMFGFVTIENGILKTTEIGKRVSELYIDPLSAHNIITKLQNFEDLTPKELMMIIADTIEIKPYFKPKSALVEDLGYKLQEEYKDYGLDTNKLIEDYEITEKFYTCQIFLDWINEVSEQTLLDNYEILPGSLHNKLYNVKWVCYAVGEIAKILEKTTIQKKSQIMEKRIKDGVKEELLLLVELPNIGRARARKLFFNGIKTIGDLKNTDPYKILNILGIKVGTGLLKHLKIEFELDSKKVNEIKSEDIKEKKEIKEKTEKKEVKKQKNLFEF